MQTVALKFFVLYFIPFIASNMQAIPSSFMFGMVVQMIKFANMLQTPILASIRRALHHYRHRFRHQICKITIHQKSGRNSSKAPNKILNVHTRIRQKMLSAKQNNGDGKKIEIRAKRPANTRKSVAHEAGVAARPSKLAEWVK